MSSFGGEIPTMSKPPGFTTAQPQPPGGGDPLHNLSAVKSRMDTLQKFLSDSVNSNTLLNQDQMNMVSTEITSAIHHIIVNAAALLSSTSTTTTITPQPTPNSAAAKIDENAASNGPVLVVDPKTESYDDEYNMVVDDEEIVELDAQELLAENVHFCDICGKGFKRDANLRMHMRAHGNQFKTPEALAKPPGKIGDLCDRRRRFSCPYIGCNRNKEHKKFKPLKSAICVKNHFKRSHCPKMYSCDRCNKKSFSVVADLRSHLKHCGETKWKCSCGTSFSRKDKLFGHMALFEGHMPAIEEEEKGKGVATVVEDDEKDSKMLKSLDLRPGGENNGFFDGLFEGFPGIEDYCFQDLLGTGTNSVANENNGLGRDMDGFFNF